MANRFLIGRGELLTRNIDAPKKKPGDKKRPYTLAEAQATIIPQAIEASKVLDKLPNEACPHDVAVSKLTLHPAYLAKSYFPTALLREAGLVSVGSRTTRTAPRKRVKPNAPETSDTTMLYVAGPRAAIRRIPQLAMSFTDDLPEGRQFAEIEAFAAMEAPDRIQPGSTEKVKIFEVGLHLWPDMSADDTREHFFNYAKRSGFKVHTEYEFQVGRLLFWPVERINGDIKTLAQYTLVRVIRPMPKLRGTRPTPRGAAISVPFSLPSAEPLSREPRVAILDGGLPVKHVLEPYIGRYFLSDENASDVPDYLEHGLGVTSAFLFGPIEPGQAALRPYSLVDHHRVLDSLSDKEDSFELYRTLGHVEAVLLSRQYQFINLSLGPDLPIEDHEVHAWTAVIDESLSDGATLLNVAVGNNGELRREKRNDRIQVPSDCVNALSVGAADHTSAKWARAPYSARGPGRQPGIRKPDLVAFGGCPKEYFHVATPGTKASLAANLGTSFASPYVMRSAVGIRAILGDAVHPLTVKALLIHGCENRDKNDPDDVGWGRVPRDINELITCDDGVARIIFQGTLRPGKFLRAPVPLPGYAFDGDAYLTATFCYATQVDPQDASAYTKAGLVVTFRPHEDKRTKGAANAKTQSFFPSSDYRSEAELRDDLGKWETVLHATHRFRETSLKNSVFDIHYNARDGGEAKAGAELIPYALVVTVRAPKHPKLYEDILAAHALLKAIEPKVSLPISV